MSSRSLESPQSLWRWGTEGNWNSAPIIPTNVHAPKCPANRVKIRNIIIIKQWRQDWRQGEGGTKILIYIYEIKARYIIKKNSAAFSSLCLSPTFSRPTYRGQALCNFACHSAAPWPKPRRKLYSAFGYTERLTPSFAGLCTPRYLRHWRCETLHRWLKAREEEIINYKEFSSLENFCIY